MNCEMAQAELKAYEDGELDRLGAWRVRRHVGCCAPCAEELRMMGKLNALLLSADLVEREAPVVGRSVSAAPAPQGPAWRSRRVQGRRARGPALGRGRLAATRRGARPAVRPRRQRRATRDA